MKQPTTVFAILLLVVGLHSAVLCKNIAHPSGGTSHISRCEFSNLQGGNIHISTMKAVSHNRISRCDYAHTIIQPIEELSTATTTHKEGENGTNQLYSSSTTTNRKVSTETNGKSGGNMASGKGFLENGLSRSTLSSQHPKENILTKSAAGAVANSVTSAKSNREKDYIGFPPYRGSTSARFQRQRRSSHSSSSTLDDMRPYSYDQAQPGELEFNLNNSDDREAFVQMLAMLRSKGDEAYPYGRNDDGDFEDEEEPAMDLGYYVKQPYGYDSSKRPTESNSLINSAAGLSFPLRNKATNSYYGAGSSSYPSYEIPMSMSAGDDSAVDDNWMDDAIPLHSHSKTRRAGNPVAMSMGYSSSPIKSHFRMLRSLRKPGYGLQREMYLQNYEPGYFGSFYPTPARKLMNKRQAVYNRY